MACASSLVDCCGVWLDISSMTSLALVQRSMLTLSFLSCFSQLFAVLGLRMKVAKALPPRKRQKLLGVVVDIGNEGVQLCPHSNRCEKLSKELQMILTADCLSDIQAQRIAGKMQFLNGTLFGQLGKSALPPIYSRAHHIGNDSAGTQLNLTLRTALQTLLTLLHEVQPRSIPLSPSDSVGILYTDAFFKMGDKMYRPGRSEIPAQRSKARCSSFENGWGFVFRNDSQVFFASGCVPAFVMRAFCSRKAYIYFLEVAARATVFHGDAAEGDACDDD